MAYQKRDAFVSAKLGRKMFLSDYVDAVGESALNQLHEVTEVRETTSRAGFLCETDAFVAMVYKSSPLCDTLMELIDELYSSGRGGALFLEVNGDSPIGVWFGTDLELPRIWVRTKKFPGGFRYIHKQTKNPRGRKGTDSAPPSTSN